MIPKTGKKPKRCWYSSLIILMFIRLILKASISFRAAPKVAQEIFSTIGILKDQPIPSDKSINRWLTRVGLYKLNLPRVQSDDWAFIIDNSIQVGTNKCLVILGVRLSTVKWKALTFEDIEILAIEIHEENGQDCICQALEQAQKKVGKVVMVCADDGPDLRSGIELFCKKNNVGRVYDTIHKIGVFLKRLLESDPQWQSFTSAAAEAKKKMQQTSAAHLMPPNQRTKSRYLNIDILTKWSVDALSILTAVKHPDQELMIEYCNWVLDYKDYIEYLRQLDLINKHVRKHIRDYGLSSHTGIYIDKLLEEALKSSSTNINACQYAGELIDFFQEHSKIVPKNQVWIGSSEIIESLFGKFKFLEQSHHKEGFTSLVLGMSACTGSLDLAIINAAMQETKTKDVDTWTKKQIGKTYLSKRRESLGGWRTKQRKRKKCCENNAKDKSEKIYNENGQEFAGIILEKVVGY